MTHIGFTGTQRGMTDLQRLAVQQAILDLGATDASHGDCVGADDQFDDLARSVGCRMHIRPGYSASGKMDKWAWCAVQGDVVHDPEPYLVRNRKIENDGEVLIGVPGEFDEQTRSGTWSTVRYARKRAKRVVLVLPDGSAA